MERTGKFPSYFAKVHCSRKVIITPMRLLKLLERFMDLAGEKDLRCSFLSGLAFCGDGWGKGGAFLRTGVKVSFTEGVFRLGEP